MFYNSRRVNDRTTVVRDAILKLQWSRFLHTSIYPKFQTLPVSRGYHLKVRSLPRPRKFGTPVVEDIDIGPEYRI